MRMLLKLLVTVLLVSQLADALKLSLRRHELQGHKLLREGNIKAYRAFKAKNLQAFKSRVGRFDVGKSPLKDSNDLLYTVNISIGTPAQYFTLIPDTAVGLTWIPDNTITSDQPDFCKTQHCFNSSASSTYVSGGQTFGDDQLGGIVGIDTVRLGNDDLGQLNVLNATFGQMTMGANSLRDLQADGYLGLTFQSNAQNNIEPVFQTAIREKLVNKPLFTVWLPQKGSENQGGQITWGDLDSEHCSSDILYIPLVEKSYFEFQVDGYSINGGEKVAEKHIAIPDSGSSLVYVPDVVFKKVRAATNARYDFNTGYYSVECYLKLNWTIYVGDKPLIVDEKVLIFYLPDFDLCYLGIEKWDNDRPDIILGDSFLREWCSVYEMEKGQVGFAKSISN